VGLGNKAAALSMAERAIAANPMEKDVVDGPASIEVLARVAAHMGEPDRCRSRLTKTAVNTVRGRTASGQRAAYCCSGPA
jgi:hypothetical protein